MYPTFAWMAVSVAIAAAAQAQPSVPGNDKLAFDDRLPAIEVNGAPGRIRSTERHAAISELAYAAPRLTAADLHSPGPLTERERRSLHSTLRSGERLQVGISRSFGAPVGFDLVARKSPPLPGERIGGGLLELNEGRLVWTAGFESPEAGALRLRIDESSLPAGTVAYVYSRSGEVHGPYDLGGLRSDPIWTNTVFASTIYLEVRFPRGSVDLSTARLNVAAIAHIENAQFAPSRSVEASSEALPDCFKDVNCASSEDLSGLDEAKHAVALMLFEQGGATYVCSGALVNTTAGNSIPYFLTANHCVNSSASAKSAELFWDYRTSTCGGPPPNRSAFERTLGAALLASGSYDSGKPDFTLLRLSQEPPAGRFYLGYSSASVAKSGGTKIFRIAHPDGGPQMLSRHSISELPTPGECSGLPQSRFIYSKNEIGATKGGSSGSPVFLADGLKIVGQLYGRCGNNIPDACDAAQNSAVDGAFAVYFPEVQRWLAPSTVAPCAHGTNNLCLVASRFKVELTARDQRTGASAAGVALAENDLFGYFSLPALTGQADNPEVFVKVLDGRAISGKFWVFYGGLTDFEFTMKVTDTETGIEKSYSKAAGSYCGDADTQAF